MFVGKTAFVHLQAVGVGRPHPLFLPNPAAFYLVAGKLAFQNDVMVKTDGLLPCVLVCVLVFRHCNGFRGGQPSGFALCPQPAKKVANVPVCLFLCFR